jgi:hypothetical protein
MGADLGVSADRGLDLTQVRSRRRARGVPQGCLDGSEVRSAVRQRCPSATLMSHWDSACSEKKA